MLWPSRLLLVAFCLVQMVAAVLHFFTPDELRYTFGVTRVEDVPAHEEVFPEVVYNERGGLKEFIVQIGDRKTRLPLESSLKGLLGEAFTHVHRTREDGGGKLSVNERPVDCHYQFKSNHTIAAISNCDGRFKGILVDDRGIHVIHPFPDRHAHRSKRSVEDNKHGVHIVYKRAAVMPVVKDFCGLDEVVTEEQLIDDESSIFEDVFVTGAKLTQESDLVVELAVFVDETLWRHFNSKYGGMASQKLQDYALTLLNNIQIMYYQPTAVPPLTFRVVRYEVLSYQPSALAGSLHSHGHAQQYLDRFCRYQRNLGVRDWDHAFLLTGYDIHRGAGSRSISGIARLDGMCDPWNTCTLAEGLDFTSAFIGTHELGHSARGKNCLRVSNQPTKLRLPTNSKPGQTYDANLQCQLMHGVGYQQVTPRQDHYDGICYMMWCGQSTFGRIITSHPALEGTFCGNSKWCQLGRCIPWTGVEPIAPQSTQMLPPPPPPPTPQKINGGWSAWTASNCDACYCSPLSEGIGLAVSRRYCNNPAPSNGGAECFGSDSRALICDRECSPNRKTVDQYITEKCAEHKRLKNDGELTGTGQQLSRYPQRACKVFCDVVNRYGTQRNYRFFGDNLPDGTACGPDRYCLDGECLALTCQNSALIGRDQACPAESCPIRTRPKVLRGEWGTWSLWSACSVTCGSGYRKRTRVCSALGNCEGSADEQEQCNTFGCPAPAPPAVSGGPSWTNWTEWNRCSVTCGRGSQARYRRCVTAQNTMATGCPGPFYRIPRGVRRTVFRDKNIEVRSCDEVSCDGIGVWSDWGSFSTCSTSCGPGTMVRQRVCRREPCDGSAHERQSCNVRVCPSPGYTGGWGSWGSWSECSVLCGKGLRTRSRLCSAGLNACPGVGHEQEFCNEQPCSAPASSSDGQWSAWGGWSTCSATCGAGVKRRTRYCQSGNCPGSYKESAICNDKECTDLNAFWGGWGYWSTCSETCGQGIRKRVRKCYGSGSCGGNEYEREACFIRNC